MNITPDHLVYTVIAIISAMLFHFKFKLIHTHAYTRRMQYFTRKALSLSIISNVLLVLVCAQITGNENMGRIALVIIIGILFDLNYYLYCKRRMARYRDASYHDITNDIRIK